MYQEQIQQMEEYDEEDEYIRCKLWLIDHNLWVMENMSHELWRHKLRLLLWWRDRIWLFIYE